MHVDGNIRANYFLGSGAYLTDLASVAFTGSASDITSGTLSSNALQSVPGVSGTYGATSHTLFVTVDDKGRVINVSENPIAIHVTAVSGLANVATSGSANDLSGTLSSNVLQTVPNVSGTYGSSSQTIGVTVDSKGRVTNIESSNIAIAANAVYGLANVATSGDYNSLSNIVFNLQSPTMGSFSGKIGIGGNANASKALYVTGDVEATGNLVANNMTASNLYIVGDVTVLNTTTSNTEQMIVNNAGTGPALKVIQTGFASYHSVAEFYDGDDQSNVALMVANGGFVGLGTTIPLSRLHVHHTGSGDIFRVDDQNAPDTTPFIIKEDGKIGIGTTNPSTSLHIQGTATSSGIISPRYYLLGVNDNTDSAGDSNDGGPWYGLGLSVDNDFSGRAQLSDFYGLQLKSGGGRMVLSGTGNVGIGTTNPLAKLHVQGGISVTTTGDNSYLVLNAGTSSAAGNQISFIDFKLNDVLKANIAINEGLAGNPLEINSATNGNLLLANGGGNVGIGTATPQSSLHVFGDITHTGDMKAVEASNTHTWFRKQSGSDYTYGLNIAFGAGGRTIVGAGESASNLLVNEVGLGGQFDEYLVLAADMSGSSRAIRMITSVQDGYDSRIEALTILGNGDVGIGVTNPLHRLHINGSALINGSGDGVTGDVTVLRTLNPNMTSNGFVNSTVGKATSANNTANFRYKHVGDGNTTNYVGIGFWANDDILNVAATKNVGIGITNPSVKLHVQGSSTELLRISDGARTIYAGCDSNEPWFGTSTNNGLRLITNGTEKGRLMADGKLGIGTSTPQRHLHVYGDGLFCTGAGEYIGGNMYWNGAAWTRVNGGTNGGFALRVGSETDGSGDCLQFFTMNSSNAAGSRMTVSASGNVGIGIFSPSYKLHVGGEIVATGNIIGFGSASDGRFKDDVKDISCALEQICKLHPVDFKWSSNVWLDDKRGSPDVGFIAQEVEDVMPKLIREFVVDGHDDKIKGIAYEKFAPYLVKAIQELDAENKALKSYIQSEIANIKAFIGMN